MYFFALCNHDKTKQLTPFIWQQGSQIWRVSLKKVIFLIIFLQHGWIKLKVENGWVAFMRCRAKTFNGSGTNGRMDVGCSQKKPRLHRGVSYLGDTAVTSHIRRADSWIRQRQQEQHQLLSGPPKRPTTWRRAAGGSLTSAYFSANATTVKA